MKPLPMSPDEALDVLERVIRNRCYKTTIIKRDAYPRAKRFKIHECGYVAVSAMIPKHVWIAWLS